MSARIPEPVTCLSPEPGSSVSLGWTPSGANWVNDRAPTPGGPGRLWLRPSTGAATPRNVTSVTRRPASSSSALVGVSVLPARPKTILPVWPGDATTRAYTPELSLILSVVWGPQPTPLSFMSAQTLSPAPSSQVASPFLLGTDPNTSEKTQGGHDLVSFCLSGTEPLQTGKTVRDSQGRLSSAFCASFLNVPCLCQWSGRLAGCLSSSWGTAVHDSRPCLLTGLPPNLATRHCSGILVLTFIFTQWVLVVAAFCHPR